MESNERDNCKRSEATSDHATTRIVVVMLIDQGSTKCVCRTKKEGRGGVKIQAAWK